MENTLNTPRFWGLHAEPGLRLNWKIGAIPFVLLLLFYLTASRIKLEENPSYKLLPSPYKMVLAVKEIAFHPNTYTGEYVMLNDTVKSLKRISLGVFLGASAGLFLGLVMGVFRGFKGLLLPFVGFVGTVPALALLPILFIAFGVDELAKVILIFLGIFPSIACNVYLKASKIPREHFTKALTLGASQLGVTFRIVLPQIMPHFIDIARLSLGNAGLFLIAAEGIASSGGLAYRIFLAQRVNSMEIIIPYVMWITTIFIAFDWVLRKYISWKYHWYVTEER